ncbi:MAG: amidohydrolase [Burkholderiaceae bacterium]|nr:amidohydrolase [Burkholderiaceae bacterium]
MIDLDIHTHLIPIHEDRLATMPGARWLADEHALMLDDRLIGLREMFEPQRLLEWMERYGVNRVLVSIPPAAYRQELPAQAARDWVCYLNDELFAITENSNAKMGALMYLPLEHPALIEGLLAQFGARAWAGVTIAAGGHPAIDYSAPHYAPLWSWLDAHDVFAFVHPSTCGDPRLARFSLENLIGSPYETGLAAAHLVMAGVPGRYPRVRFCLAHAGGIFTTLVGRLQHGFATHRPGVDLQQELPLQAARRFYADCMAHHPGVLGLAREVFGEDHILFGSGWPLPMGIEDPAAVVG